MGHFCTLAAILVQPPYTGIVAVLVQLPCTDTAFCTGTALAVLV